MEQSSFYKYDGLIWFLRDQSTLLRGDGPRVKLLAIDQWDDGLPKIGSAYAFPCDYTGKKLPVRAAKADGEKSGGSVDYYQVRIENPTTKGRDKYTAECNDIIEALGMNYAEGNAFKAIWRSCAERTLGKKKAGGNAVYDAEKMVFFSQRVLVQRKEIKCN